jgi:hypothetical protein
LRASNLSLGTGGGSFDPHFIQPKIGGLKPPLQCGVRALGVCVS